MDFDKFLKENQPLALASRQYAEDMLGDQASEKAITNVMVVFTMGAVWQASQFTEEIERKRSKADSEKG